MVQNKITNFNNFDNIIYLNENKKYVILNSIF